MKLLFFISSLQCGGAERVAATLCSHWAERGLDVTIATFEAPGTPPAFPLAGGVRHVALGIRSRSTGLVPGLLNNLRRVPHLRRMIASEAPDRILSFIDATNVLVLLAAKGKGIPVVVGERTDPNQHVLPAPWRLLRRLTYAWADGIAVQTAGAASYFPQNWAPRIGVIPNPVPRIVRAPRMAAITPSRRTIVAMGRLDRVKGFDRLIRAFASLAPERPEWDMTILGEGPERAALQDAIDGAGLAGRIRMPGQVDDPWVVMSEAELFVLSSRYEGFPNALCEAMACGLASIAFDCPSGPRDIVRHDVDGLLVPDGDITALAEAMRRVTGDDHLRARLAARAPEVSDRFSVERIAMLWEELMGLS